MKRYILTVMAAAVLAGIAIAQEPAEPQEQQRPERRGRGQFGERIVARMKEELGLSGGQEEEVTEIVQRHLQSAREWFEEHREEFGELREAMRKAREANDQEALQELREKFGEYFREGRERLEDFRTEFEGILTKEQVEKARTLMQQRGFRRRQQQREGGDVPLSALRRLNLTKEQQLKVDEILKAAREKIAKIKDPRKRREASQTILKAAMEKIKKEVLTDKQRQQLAVIEQRMAQARRGRGRRDPLAGVDLTEDQKKQVAEIRETARKQSAEAKDPATRRDILRKAEEKIRDEVLTDEQRAKLRQPRRGRRRRGPAPEQPAE